MHTRSLELHFHITLYADSFLLGHKTRSLSSSLKKLLLLPHTEKILIAAIVDPDKEIDNDSLTKILTARRNNDARLCVFFLSKTYVSILKQQHISLI